MKQWSESFLTIKQECRMSFSYNLYIQFWQEHLPEAAPKSQPLLDVVKA